MSVPAMSVPVIGFVGMTHLGVNSAAAAAARGFATVGFDPDPARAAALARAELPVLEPGLPELFAEHGNRLRFTADTAELGRCDVVYIACDVPTDDVGGSDLTPVRVLIATVAPFLRPDATLVVLCQVPPGFTRALGAELGRTEGGLLYQVETLIFGRAVERALHPERVIVGVADPARPLPVAFAAFLGAFGCPILPMRYESAELAKISINMCLVAMVSTANTLAELCERIGADWSEIAPSLKLDRRIGPYAYLQPGLGIAGGNLERDLATVCRLADEHGSDAGMVRSWIANSRHRRDWALRTVQERVLVRVADPVFAVWGLTYKQDTHSIKNSPSLALLSGLGPFAVRAYDPAVAANPTFHPRLTGAADPLDACRGADALLVMTSWDIFRAVDPKEIAAALHGREVIDPYGILDPAACRAAGLTHVTLGRRTDADET
jgi:UDPglucose 6-dehydrogenase